VTGRDRVEDYLRHLAVERGRARNTLVSYRRDLRIYQDWLSSTGWSFDAIGEQQLTDFVRYLGAEREPALATSSVARILSAVRGLHRFLTEEGVTVVDAASQVRPPKLPRRLPKAIPVEEVTRLLAAAAGDDPVSLRNTALLELLYATGARVSEAVALNVDDLLEEEVIRLFGKGGKERIVPLGSYARRALEAYLVRARAVFIARGTERARRTPGDTAALFLGARGARMSRQSAWEIIRDAAEAVGVAASPHTLRHSFATHVLEGGADVRVVQELLGHASVSTTQIYTLVTADTLREMYLMAHPRAR